MANGSFSVNGIDIRPGERVTIDLPVASLYTHTPLTMPVHVIRGRRSGPGLFVSAAIHGDEINGVEIIRRLLRLAILKRLRGTLIAVPIVNVHGFVSQSRYLPDRRDLNRAFPGSVRGSLAARLANLVMTEIVGNCTHGIDLHTGARHRDNLPQIRADMDDAQTASLAYAFGVPVILDANLRDGSLREAAADRGVPMLLYEGGEALRFDEVPIRAGVRGVINVMRALQMLPPSERPRRKQLEPLVARSSSWVRAPISGILRRTVRLGGRVKKEQPIGVISDPFGGREIPVLAPFSGVVIGCTNLPLANEGEALYHVARFHGVAEAADQVAQFQKALQPNEDTPAS